MVLLVTIVNTYKVLIFPDKWDAAKLQIDESGGGTRVFQ